MSFTTTKAVALVEARRLIRSRMALTLILIAIPVLNERLGIADFFVRHVLSSARLWTMLLASLCVVTLIAGAYPAFVLSNSP